MAHVYLGHGAQQRGGGRASNSQDNASQALCFLKGDIPTMHQVMRSMWSVFANNPSGLTLNLPRNLSAVQGGY
jgi:hypothetical protein